MIWDCFLFNNELDLLELRLSELSDVVDRFVLAETRHNFQMRPKPTFYGENKKRFESFSHRIVHVVVEDCPVEPHPAMEHFQRRALFRGVRDADPGDIVLMGDVDEIPDKAALWSMLERDESEPVVFVQRLYYYYVNCLQDQPWWGTVAFRRGVAETMDFQAARDSRGGLETIDPGGWHFSWLGTPSDISYKMRSIDVVADSELCGSPRPDMPDPEDLDEIQRRCDSGEDLMGRKEKMFRKRFVEIEPGAGHPHSMLEWLARYPSYAKSA